jgi:hypothetical protein
METQTYTIFARWADGTTHAGSECWFPPYSQRASLEDRIEYVRSFNGGGAFIPIAWAVSDKETPSLRKPLLAESIAAGRTIEQIDGRYVPRGVPVEDKPAETLGDLLRQVLDRGVTVPPKYIGIDWAKDCAPATPPQPTKERTRPALTWADSKPFDRFPGFVVVKSVPELGNPVLLAQGPFQRVNDGSDPHHGSAWLKVR